MRVRLAVALSGLVLASLAPAARPADALPDLEEPKEKLSYALGAALGQRLADRKLEVDPELLARGVSDALAGRPALAPEDVARILRALGPSILAPTELARPSEADELKRQGEAFLLENRAKEGVRTTESGLQYLVLREGSGRRPKLTDSVRVHYRGAFIDGREFDSSRSRGKPTTAPVNGVIPGWTEALQLMREGSKWRLFLPSELGYGAAGKPPSIPPHATLVFEIELLEIAKPGAKGYVSIK